MKRIVILLITLFAFTLIFGDIRCDTETVTVDTTTYTKELQIDWQDYIDKTIIMKNLNDSLIVYYEFRHFSYASSFAPSDADDTDKLYYTEMSDSLLTGEQVGWDMSETAWARTDIYIKAGTDTLDVEVQIEWSAIK